MAIRTNNKNHELHISLAHVGRASHFEAFYQHPHVSGPINPLTREPLKHPLAVQEIQSVLFNTGFMDLFGKILVGFLNRGPIRAEVLARLHEDWEIPQVSGDSWLDLSGDAPIQIRPTHGLNQIANRKNDNKGQDPNKQ